MHAGAKKGESSPHRFTIDRLPSRGRQLVEEPSGSTAPAERTANPQHILSKTPRVKAFVFLALSRHLPSAGQEGTDVRHPNLSRNSARLNLVEVSDASKGFFEGLSS